MSSITFAMNRCKDFIDYCCHNDIDIEEEIKIWEHDWDVFLTHHYLLTHESAKFLMIEECSASVALVENYVELCRSLLDRIKPLWPQFGLDGEYAFGDLYLIVKLHLKHLLLKFASLNKVLCCCILSLDHHTLIRMDIKWVYLIKHK